MAVNIALVTFSPIAIVPTLLVGLALGALILLVISSLRRRVIAAVTDQALLLLDCGRVPGRWTPHGVIHRGEWTPILDATRASARRGPHLEVDGRTYWIAGSDHAELRRIARWIVKHD